MKNNRLLTIVFLLICNAVIAQNWDWWPLGLTHENLKGDTLRYNAELLRSEERRVGKEC